MTEQASQVPPHAFESERALLGHLLDHPESFKLVDGLRPEHFYERTTRALATATWAVGLSGRGIDAASIAAALRQAGTWTSENQRALVMLESEPAIPPGHVAQHAQAIRDKAYARELISSCRSIASLIQGGADSSQAVSILRNLIEQQKQPSRPLLMPRTNVELCQLLAGSGPRIPLGIQQLDDKLHGGMRTRKLLAVGGPPGSWKTALLVQIADYLCQQPGVVCAWCAYDECAEEVMSRRLQARGVPRCRAEDPDDETLLVAAELDALPFIVFENKPFDEVIETFARLYPNAERFVFVDSAQKMWTQESRQLTTLRERIDCSLETLRHLAESPTTACAVLMTSELARGAYRSKSGTDQTDDLAAGKESGSIEYSLDVWCVLRNVPGEQETITLTIPKNRIGSKTEPDCPIEFFPDRVHVQLRALSEDARTEIHERSAAIATDRAKAKVLQALKRNPQGLGTDDLRDEAHVRKQEFNRATRRLLADGLVVKEESGKSHKALWRLSP